MQSHANAEEDRSSQLTPPLRPAAPWRVAQLEVLPEFRLRVRFNDGTEGVVELAAFLNSPHAGVFGVLRAEEQFGKARIEIGAVTWPGNLAAKSGNMGFGW